MAALAGLRVWKATGGRIREGRLCVVPERRARRQEHVAGGKLLPEVRSYTRRGAWMYDVREGPRGGIA